MPSDRELTELYSGDYEFRVDETSLLRFRAMSGRVVDELKRLHPPGRTLLDIGAGYGTFVEVAISNGFDAVGIEPARNLYKLANSKVKGKILHSDLENFTKKNIRKYDFISLIHVIEHVKFPKAFLKTVLALLKPGGVLYIETPNSCSHQAIVEGQNYTFLTPPDHTNLFSSNSLQKLLNDLSKTSVRSYKTYSYSEHFVGILRSIKNGTSNSPQSAGKLKNESFSGGVIAMNNSPFFDRVVAPLLTPLLNIGNKGSFLQFFIQKKN